MRKVNLLEDFKPVALTKRCRRRRPFTDTIHGEDHGLVERRWIERRRRVAQMMFGEQQSGPIELFVEFVQLLSQQALLEQLFLQPQRNRHLEGAETCRRQRDIGLEQPLEFQERLVVENDMVDVGKPCARGFQTVADRMHRKRRIVLLAREAFFLRGRFDAAVLDQRGCAVVIEGGDAENTHYCFRTACK